MIISAVTYTINGSIQQITYGNGSKASYAYDPLTKRLTTQVLQNSASQVLQSLEYVYDPLGNITEIRDNITNTKKSYVYDSLNRMISSDDGTQKFR